MTPNSESVCYVFATQHESNIGRPGVLRCSDGKGVPVRVAIRKAAAVFDSHGLSKVIGSIVNAFCLRLHSRNNIVQHGRSIVYIRFHPHVVRCVSVAVTEAE